VRSLAEYDLGSWTSPDLVKADDISVLRRFARSVTKSGCAFSRTVVRKWY
jgi:hypothetical protein